MHVYISVCVRERIRRSMIIIRVDGVEAISKGRIVWNPRPAILIWDFPLFPVGVNARIGKARSA